MPLLEIDFSLDEETATYQRKVLKFSDVLSMTGGLMGIVFALVRIALEPF